MQRVCQCGHIWKHHETPGTECSQEGCSCSMFRPQTAEPREREWEPPPLERDFETGPAAPRESERSAEYGDTPEFLRTLAGSSEEVGQHVAAAIYRVGAAIVAAIDRQTEAMKEPKRATHWAARS